MMFTIFDISIFTIISLSSILGFYKGLINITINLFGLVASIVLAVIIFPYLKSLFLGYIENQLLLSFVSGTISYVFSLIVLTILTNKILAFSSLISRGIIDRFLGLIFGVARGFLLAIIIFAIVAIGSSGAYVKAQNFQEIMSNLHKEQYPEYLAKSKTTNFLEKLFRKSVKFVPENVLKHDLLPKTKSHENVDIIDEIKATKKEK